MAGVTKTFKNLETAFLLMAQVSITSAGHLDRILRRCEPLVVGNVADKLEEAHQIFLDQELNSTNMATIQ
jgi:hypothetical protein